MKSKVKDRRKLVPGTHEYILREIRDYLRTIGVMHWKQWQGQFSVPGISDIIGIKKISLRKLMSLGVEEVGIFTAIEVKTEKSKLTREQEDFLRVVQENGGIAIEARSIKDVEGLNR